MSTGQDPGSVGEVLYFFFSYARTPRLPDDPGDPDEWIAELYTDLCRHVVQLTSGKSPTVGFMDREMRLGAQWPNRLAHALSSCRVFVPLYSPRYFKSVECGKEWSAFSRRVENQAARLGESPIEAIVPALWVPVDPDLLPSAARSIQFSHHSLGARYGKDGFWGIMKVKRYRDDYEIAVRRLAHRIVQVALQAVLERETPPDYNSLTSAFVDRVGPGEQRRLETARQAGRRMHIMIAAPTSHDAPDGRRELAYYGVSEREWNPYLPESPAKLADYAAELTVSLGYRPTVVPFDELASAEAAGPDSAAPGLFLVDPWAAAMDGKADRLREFDEQAEPWVSVMIPWNRADPETMAAKPTLQPQVSGVLSHLLDHAPSEHRQATSDIATLADFADILPNMAHTANTRFLEEAQAYPPSGPPIPRPMLLGPYPDDSEGMQ